MRVKPEKSTKSLNTANTSSLKVVALEKCYSKQGTSCTVREITVCAKLPLCTVEGNVSFMPATYFQSTVSCGSDTDSGWCFSFLF